MKCEYDVYHYDVPCMFHVLLKDDSELTKSEFKKVWKQYSDDSEVAFTLDVDVDLRQEKNLSELLETNNIKFVASRKKKDNSKITAYYYCQS